MTSALWSSWKGGRTENPTDLIKRSRLRMIQWSWRTVAGKEGFDFTHIPVVVSSSLYLHGCCWAGWRLFITTTKQNQQHFGAGVYTALSDFSLLQVWDVLVLETSPGQSVLPLAVVHYLPRGCVMQRRMWSQVHTPKSSRSKLPRDWLTATPSEPWLVL